MNLAIIEKMVKDGNMGVDCLNYLLNCHGECERLDFKQELHIERDKELCDFAKDVVAIKNIGGGYILVGVEDKTWKPIGVINYLMCDSKMIRDKIRKCTGLELDVDIVSHQIQFSEKILNFDLIFIRGSKKKSKLRMPSLIGKDFQSNQPFGLRRGKIYFRNGDSTVKVKDEQELLGLIESLEDHFEDDAFANTFQSSPFAIEDGPYRLLEKGFENFVGRSVLRKNVEQAVTQDPRIWIVNVHGPGGVGKSALVNWVVYKFYEERTFESIIHLTAKETILTQAGIRPYSRSLYSLENLLDHILNSFQESIPEDLEQKKTKVVEYLSAWRTLLVLDNMETITDGRILSFIQFLPPQIMSKVLITSRQKTGGWELPLPVNEFNKEEVREFVKYKSLELKIDFPLDDEVVEKVQQVSGGLPLAIQWMIGQYKILRRIDHVLDTVGKKDSPILEFTGS